MDYTKLTVEDLAADESFITWINGKDPDVEEFWTTLLSSHPEMAPKISKARTLVLNIKRAQEIHYNEKRLESMFQTIQHRIGESTALEKKKIHKTFNVKYALASLVLVTVLLVAGLRMSYTNADDKAALDYHNTNDQYIEQLNPSANTVSVKLGDGSTVSLGKNSRLKYKNSYDNDSTRDVYLVGEAFFEVAKNPFKPFIVHSGEVVTEVLGTSFRIQAHENDKNIMVSVKSGKVSVYDYKKFSSLEDKKKNGVILFPNQQVNYERQQQTFKKEIVAEPEIIVPSISKNDFMLENAPIAEVFGKLQTAYGIEILFNEEIMKNCFITAPLGSEPLFEKLKIICQTIGANYEIIDTKVIIDSTGCL